MVASFTGGPSGVSITNLLVGLFVAGVLTLALIGALSRSNGFDLPGGSAGEPLTVCDESGAGGEGCEGAAPMVGLCHALEPDHDAFVYVLVNPNGSAWQEHSAHPHDILNVTGAEDCPGPVVGTTSEAPTPPPTTPTTSTPTGGGGGAPPPSTTTPAPSPSPTPSPSPSPTPTNNTTTPSPSPSPTPTNNTTTPSPSPSPDNSTPPPNTTSPSPTPTPNQAPTASVGANVDNGTAPLNVTFSLAGDDPDGDPVHWTFDADGDGVAEASGTLLPDSLVHEYTSAGTYTATLIVTDSVDTTQASVQITVEAPPAPGPSPSDGP